MIEEMHRLFSCHDKYEQRGIVELCRAAAAGMLCITC